MALSTRSCKYPPGRKQSKKQHNRLSGLQRIALAKQLPVIRLREMPEQPAGVPMGDDMCLFVINKRVQQQELFTILSREKRSPGIPVNICVSTHTKGREETLLILALLKLMADLGQGQPAAASAPERMPRMENESWKTGQCPARARKPCASV